ncbi:MAG: restriction endonuclease [Phycisphaerae bacterium]|nr:restriction endonuclease [Phycisphaerae bacterium]
MSIKNILDIEKLCKEACFFAKSESKHNAPSLFGVTDGKAVGTYFEHKFKKYLLSKYDFSAGNSASGIDFPDIGVDMKVTSIKQPQSSCPYKSARQKIFGLGYSLLVFVYDKTDNEKTKTGRLNILHSVFIEKSRTGDYQTTTGLRKIIENQGNSDDIVAFLHERMLPMDEIEAEKIAKDILKSPPEIGYLTISNALQWRLQYNRIIEKAGKVNGILRVH